MAYAPEFSSDFSHFQNPLLIVIPQENCIGAAIPSSTCGEEISFPMFLDNGGVDVFQQEPNNLTPSVPKAAARQHSPGCSVFAYSVEERKDRILRYLKKRNQRNFNKTVDTIYNKFSSRRC
ncbi:hypothetical protein HRI_004715500 [Hibiscus trionum]|uniref:CCT domain-containing protein n=1 Tax=Hibiscus trionum TaxID=183268 RepID=A0A9W7MMG2_HIBTR|nr:hypothetical protein HRI_004715500 [Hibiscus trionum]